MLVMTGLPPPIMLQLSCKGMHRLSTHSGPSLDPPPPPDNTRRSTLWLPDARCRRPSPYDTRHHSQPLLKYLSLPCPPHNHCCGPTCHDHVLHDPCCGHTSTGKPQHGGSRALCQGASTCKLLFASSACWQEASRMLTTPPRICGMCRALSTSGTPASLCQHVTSSPPLPLQHKHQTTPQQTSAQCRMKVQDGTLVNA